MIKLFFFNVCATEGLTTKSPGPAKSSAVATPIMKKAAEKVKRLEN